jgi:cytochrome c oxidase subunit 2
MKLRLVLFSFIGATLIAAPSSIHSMHAEAAPKRVEVTAKRFTFTPAEITLKKGEPAVIVLKSEDVTHGLRFKDLGINTKIPKGQTTELAVTPDKTGNFVGQCSSFCGSGHGGMKLTLHVVE